MKHIHTTKMRKTPPPTNPLPLKKRILSIRAAKLTTFPELGEIASNFGLNYIKSNTWEATALPGNSRKEGCLASWKQPHISVGKAMQQKNLEGEKHIRLTFGVSSNWDLRLNWDLNQSAKQTCAQNGLLLCGGCSPAWRRLGRPRGPAGLSVVWQDLKRRVGPGGQAAAGQGERKQERSSQPFKSHPGSAQASLPSKA